jgi:hypothetical protein
MIYIGDKLWLIPTLCTSIHPSDPWPLAGHPEAMKMSLDYFHTSAYKRNNANFAFTEFCEVRLREVLRSPQSPGPRPTSVPG